MAPATDTYKYFDFGGDQSADRRLLTLAFVGDFGKGYKFFKQSHRVQSIGGRRLDVRLLRDLNILVAEYLLNIFVRYAKPI